MSDTKITPAMLRLLRPEIAAALADLGRKHGLEFTVGNGSYGDGFFAFKLEGKVEGGVGKEGQDFKAYARFIGLEPDDLGATFENRGHVNKIVGLKPRTEKIIVENGGKLYLMSAPDVVRLLARQRSKVAV